MSLANLVPVWAFRYFPGQDTPNHLYARRDHPRRCSTARRPRRSRPRSRPRSRSSRTCCSTGSCWGSAGWASRSTSPHRLVLSGYALAFPLAGLACLRAANPRNAALALLLLPLVWSWFALQGLYNYVLSLAPALVWLGIVARDGGRPGRRAGRGRLARGARRLPRPRGDVRRAAARDRGARRASRRRPAGPCSAIGCSRRRRWRSSSRRRSRSPLSGLGGAARARVAARADGVALGELRSAGGGGRVLRRARDALPRPGARGAGAAGGGAARRSRSPPRGGGRPAGRRAGRSSRRCCSRRLYFALPHIVFGSDASPRLRPLILFCLCCYAGVSLSRRARRRVAALALASGLLGAATLSAGLRALRPGPRRLRLGNPPGPPGEPPLPDGVRSEGRFGPGAAVPACLGVLRHRPPRRHAVRVRLARVALPLPVPRAAAARRRLAAAVRRRGRALRARRRGACAAAVRRQAPSLSCADVRRDAEERLARLGAGYDYVLTWAAPAGLRRACSAGAATASSTPGASWRSTSRRCRMSAAVTTRRFAPSGRYVVFLSRRAVAHRGGGAGAVRAVAGRRPPAPAAFGLHRAPAPGRSGARAPAADRRSHRARRRTSSSRSRGAIPTPTSASPRRWSATSSRSSASELRAIDYRADASRAFFEHNRALYADLRDLRRADDDLGKLIASRKNPAFIPFSDADLGEEDDDPAQGSREASRPTLGAPPGGGRFPHGYYESEDRTLLAIVTWTRSSGTGDLSGFAIRDDVRRDHRRDRARRASAT